MKKTNNKGFSLVELIVVIAIMAVLVGVLAPTFLRYVEDSRRAKDIQMAASLQTAYLADIADGEITASVTTPTKIVDSNRPTTLSETPVISGRLTTVTAFYFTCDAVGGTVTIYGGTDADPDAYELSSETGADNYKDATNP